MLNALRICLCILGVTAVAIALSILTRGAEATAALGEQAFDLMIRARPSSSGHWPATMDSELRFYAALWGAYGVAALGCARSSGAVVEWTPWVAAVFFVGGVGRVVSLLAVGPPHPFFSFLMWIELLLPVLLMALWLWIRERTAT